MRSRLAIHHARTWFLLLLSATAAACSASSGGSEMPDAGAQGGACCDGRGTCEKRSSLSPDDAALWAEDSCDDSLVCVPTGLQPLTAPAACTASASGAEGRCLPACFGLVASYASVLAQDGCERHERCLPCFDPLDGRETGACDLADDPGPARDAVSLAECCAGTGRCLAAAAMPEADAAAYPQDACDDDQLCVHAPAVRDGADYVPQTCSTNLLMEGRCLPACSPLLDADRGRLSQNGCDAGHLCAPCADPATGAATGACSLGADPGPLLPPLLRFDNCCHDLGHCIPASFVPEDVSDLLGRDSCDSAQLCAPDALASDTFVPDTCAVSALGDAEGRCVPDCVPAVADQAELLARDGCPEFHLCAPCYDPLSGTDIGTCRLGADPGPQAPAPTFDACCGGVGHCLPSTLLPEAQRAQLGPEGCDEAALCVPDAFASPSFVPATCTAAALGDAEGRCLPACLPAVTAQADQLAQDGCAETELCAPCYDPFSGSPTGVCSLPADPGPQQPPTVFDTCCGALGHCLPGALVPEEAGAYLSPLTCDAEAALCVPDAFLDPAFVPASCELSTYSAEGRCVPACLASVDALSDVLAQDGCPAEYLCAPCYEPFGGTGTGICGLGTDPGPEQPPIVFDSCCGALGRCLPDAFVPEGVSDRLSPLSCTAQDALCVPEAFLSTDFAPPTCTLTAFGAEGRCLPACLPDIADQADLLAQEDCAEAHLCAPCFDPFSGEPTGVCGAFGSDPGPTTEPSPLPTCCGGLGHCLPDAVIPEAQRESLAALECTADAALCLPDAFLDPAYVAPTCTTEDYGAEGRCLPGCLQQLEPLQPLLSQSSCAPAHLCAPCYDPVTGSATGVCGIGSDPGPAQPPVVFDTCCGGGGRCVPGSFGPGGAGDQLAVDSCTGAGQVCAPNEFVADLAYVPPVCTVAALGAEGRCLSSCLPAVAGLSDVLSQDGCQAGALCAPCFDPVSGAATGACAFPGDPGPSGPPVTLASCCGDAGLCAPGAWVPAGQASFLSADGCDAGAGQLCVAPSGLISDPAYRPATCTDPRNAAEGRCLPTCVPAVAQGGDLLVQASCAATERCVPCYDPIYGDATGVCGLGADPGPSQPPTVFERCCEQDSGERLGLCLSPDFAPDGADALPQLECTGQDDACAPLSIVLGEDHTACRAFESDGVCLPECFITGLAGALTPQDICADTERCVPCDLIGGAAGGCPQ